MDILNNIPVNDLANLGFECATNGLEQECEAICQGIELVNSDSTVPQLLRAISAINSKKYSDALTTLSSTTPTTAEERELVKSLSAMSRLSLGDIHEGNSLLKEIEDSSVSQTSVNLATHLLSMGK